MLDKFYNNYKLIYNNFIFDKKQLKNEDIEILKKCND